ncbi:thiopurine S-methyltransferase [Pseudomonas sp. 5P_3.1_Bac2]|uniref:thiopurine S-methyltransferase n=1 Tax=Pseudomonas sp. 5P_3.1_Bac2 TaxID=2971617 RepID=UPI0021C88E9B|nr:thiopurine S-methyltransferase [Pseudomonas sp. 5P_3.1_Bac2]MCU1716140.1 thiopurine S-methyltransferase [Pseudomonas sp. 5P_3.1_Bac2]
MHAEFWHKRWERSEIGFHQQQTNRYLQRYWAQLAVPDNAQVLVPLCGKSLDMLWLAGQGLRVLGVELSHKAVEAFFAEQGLTAQVRSEPHFIRYSSGPLEILCGDFFALSADDLSQCQAFYDRAALIALPEPLRQRYVAHLAAVLPQGGKGLLVSLDYQQEDMPGPPFAVADAEVQRLYGGRWQVQRLLQQDVRGEAENARLLQRGLSRLDEWVYRLEDVL